MNSKPSILAVIAIILCLLVAGVAAAQDGARGLPANLVENNSFEGGVLSPWVVKNSPDLKDKVKCGELGLIDDCAFMFKGSAGEATKLMQTYVASENPSTLQYVGFVGEVRPVKGSAIIIDFFVKVIFNNGDDPIKAKQTYTASAPSENYSAVEFGTDPFDSSTVAKVKFGAKNKSQGGKAYVDWFFVGAYDAPTR